MNINIFNKNNYIGIILFILLFFGLLISFSVLGINLNKESPPTKLIQEVTIESFENTEEKLSLLQEIKDMNLFPLDSFCLTHLGKSNKLEDACLRLTKNTCLDTKCCIYSSLGKCVAGKANGPIFLKNNKDLDYYYYQNKKFVRL